MASEDFRLPTFRILESSRLSGWKWHWSANVKSVSAPSLRRSASGEIFESILSIEKWGFDIILGDKLVAGHWGCILHLDLRTYPTAGKTYLFP